IINAPVLSDVGSLSIFGLDLQVSAGLGGLLGVIIAAYIFAKIEHFVRKRTQESLELLVIPLITFLVIAFVTNFVIQPIAGFLMSGLTWFMIDIMLQLGGVFGCFVLSATFLPLVTLGLHQGLVPLHLDLIENFGSTMLLPILAMAGGGQVGAAFAIYLKTKDN